MARDRRLGGAGGDVRRRWSSARGRGRLPDLPFVGDVTIGFGVVLPLKIAFGAVLGTVVIASAVRAVLHLQDPD